MSFFTRIVTNVKEFYSEINAATLTGAIDVIVVEQEDGTFKSSPFHVRFGKLGVLKAKEKIVDLEVNGEPVELHMKLDDTGAAFFVQQMSSSCDDDSWSQELATSPIPDQGAVGQGRRERTSYKPVNLFPETSTGTPMVENLPDLTVSQAFVSSESQTDVLEESLAIAISSGVAGGVEEVLETELLRKGKTNLKKRRRKKQQRHSRSGSKTSLKEIMSSSVTGSDLDMFHMDDVNDADQEEDELDLEENILCSSLPRNLEFANSFDLTPSSVRVEVRRTDSTTTQSDEVAIENSLIGSRVPLIPKSSSEAEALAALLVAEDEMIVEEDQFRPKSVAAGFHYFSDGEATHSTPRPATPGMLSDSEFENSQRRLEVEHEVWRWGEVPNTSLVATPAVPGEEKSIKQELEDENMDTEPKSWFGGWGSKNTPRSEVKEEGGIYLDDLMNDPEKLAVYLNPVSSLPEMKRGQEDLHDPLADLVDREEDAESGNGRSVPMSPQGIGARHASSNYESDCDLQDLPSLISKHLPDLAASLCGGLTDQSITLESFESCLLTYPQFLERMRGATQEGGSVVTDPNLVIRVHEKYLSWAAAAPILLSVMLFRQPLPSDLLLEITKDGLDVNVNLSPEEVKQNRKGPQKSSTWFGWLSGNKSSEDIKKEKELKPETENTTAADIAERVDFSSQTESDYSSMVSTAPRVARKESEVKDSDSSEADMHEQVEVEEDGGKKKRFRKTLRLSSEQLAALNLVPGSNEVQFSVTTAFQGTTRCLCHIYLWHHTDKVVISDIDGTITKSDVLGHILPVIGRDWAQSGVARLFSKIRNNGYHIMYLSARAIGQASITKDYLQSVKQGDVCLPDGPLFLNPDSLIHAFRREVIDRNPEEFKIRCLKDIQSIFEEKNPFFAGYGNRPNDAFAYAAVGIPVSRIFTINPAGELRHELTKLFQTSYTEQNLMVDQVFPPIGVGFDPEFKIQEFSSFGFWREQPIELELKEMEDLLDNGSRNK